MIPLGDLLWQSGGEPNTPETMVDGLVGQRLRIVPSAVATIGDTLRSNIDSDKPDAELRAPEADTVPSIQPNTGEIGARQEEEIDDEVVSGDAYEVPDGVINIEEYWDKKRRVEKYTKAAADAHKQAEIAVAEYELRKAA